MKTKKATKKSSTSRALRISKKRDFFISRSVSSTYRLGQLCGEMMKKGVIALYGDLGAGKTVFAKGVADALGVKNARREVISPSFMIVREHQGKVPFYHIDLYRIGSEDELYQLDLESYLNQEGVVLIEWAERAVSVLPVKRQEVFFEVLGEKERRIRFQPELVRKESKP